MTKAYFFSLKKEGRYKQSKNLLFLLIGLFVISILCIIIGSIPQIMKISSSSPEYDCDDATLQAYNFFTQIGIKTQPVAGDLKRASVSLSDIDHVWLIAELGPIKLAFDWGRPCFDRSHYKGYEISVQRLEEWVIEDRRSIE